ncbi:glycerophosphodiester phosphodiesterase [Solicola sp. PLA-1-18]|uniref:glycerophosphodiester phosphodiesterase n=1 Tax=Solicola sp. PLA-1-18 TaxID=3380532 RepID=UPI003B816433
MTLRTPLRASAPAAVVATAAALLVGLVGVPSQAASGPSAAVAATSDRHGKTDDTLVFGHRGASGYRPEHTLASYKLAMDMGADYVEPDLVSTKDGKLVARHENEIATTTDVADHPEFADRKTTKTIDGVALTGWFTEDFTLRELKTLRAKERLPQTRPANTRYDGLYEIPTLEEVIALVKKENRRRGTNVGIAPETKHPTYFQGIGLGLERPLLRTLAKAGLDKKRSKVVIQSFETTNLKYLNARTPVPLVQLTSAAGAPYDLVAQGDPRTWADVTSASGLRQVAKYADWLGPEKNQVIPRDAAGFLAKPTTIVRDAHRAGLDVVVYTFRDENQFLPADFRDGTDPNTKGDSFAEYRAFLATGIDAIFTDQPDTLVAYLELQDEAA